jgi:hypothetical protein
MVDGGNQDHRQFIRALVTLCREKSSGTVFYNLDSGLSARMVLNRGEICWVAYGELRGQEALEDIRLIDKGRMSFNPSLRLTLGKQTLPSTPEILRELNTREFDKQNSHSATDQKRHQSNSNSAQIISGKTFNKEEVCEIVVKESIEFIGPIAKVICAEYMKPLASEINLSSVRKLIDTIFIDINDEAKGKQFKERVKTSLKIE